MTPEQKAKAELYDNLVRRGDVIQRRISQLKSSNIGGNNPQELQELENLKREFARLEAQMNQLMSGQ